jgi:cation transport ATPase
LIALNAKAINSFDEKDENERVDERTKERESVYELKRKANVMMKKKTYKIMMMMKEKRNQANKRKKSKKKSKNKEKKRKKKKRFNCDSFVMMRRFKNEMRFFIFENLQRMFFVSRFNTTMFSLIFINFFTRFEI